MNNMKKTLLVISFILLFASPKLFAQFEGTVGFGVHTGYGAEINSLGVGAHIHYYRTNNLRFVPSYTYFIERKNERMWMVDADAHYILPVSITASLYPIAGLHYSHWTFNEAPDQVRKNRLGLNLGLGFQHDISYRVRANIDMKYQMIRDYSQLVLMAGFGFWF